MKLHRLFLFAFLLASCAKPELMSQVKTKLSPETEKLAASMQDQGKEHIHMPTLPQNYSADGYYNVIAADLSKEKLKGKVVLLDIWDYTCVNCIRTLPYIKSWAEKYKNKGLVVIGIHAPEFDFEKNAENLKAAIARFGITYPNIADNEYQIWDSLANKYWPAKYLFDKEGILRTTHTGEGEYQEFEAFIQKILLERDSTVAMPNLTDVVRASDKSGSVCYRPTPETYIGYSRNHPANTEEIASGKTVSFKQVSKYEDDRLYFEGIWKFEKEFAVPTDNRVSALLIRYQAKEVNLVIHPQSQGSFKVLVEQDGKPVPKEDRGTDVIEEDRKTYLLPKEPKMYNIINNSKFGRFALRLSSDSPSFGAYAFTFTTDCKE